MSDEGLEASADDRLSFRRCCGIPLDRPAPDHSSIWRFRQPLTEKDEAGLTLGQRLLAAINRQLYGKGLVLKRGTLIDASMVMSATRAPVERPFAAMKGPFYLSRCRAFGLARNDAHLQLSAGACPLKTALGLSA